MSQAIRWTIEKFLQCLVHIRPLEYLHQAVLRLASEHNFPVEPNLLSTNNLMSALQIVMSEISGTSK